MFVQSLFISFNCVNIRFSTIWCNKNLLTSILFDFQWCCSRTFFSFLFLSVLWMKLMEPSYCFGVLILSLVSFSIIRFSVYPIPPPIFLFPFLLKVLLVIDSPGTLTKDLSSKCVHVREWFHQGILLRSCYNIIFEWKNCLIHALN